MNFRTARWGRFATVAVVSITMAGFCAPVLQGQSANTLYREGQQAETRDDMDAAFAAYAKAYQKSPQDIRFKEAYERTRSGAASQHVHRGEQLRDKGDDAGALTEYLRALEIDPSYQVAQQDIQTAQKRMASPAPGQETSVTVGSQEALGAGERAGRAEAGFK